MTSPRRSAEHGEADPKAPAREGSPLRVVGTIAWAFFGVRRSKDLAKDAERLSPVHVVIAGIVGALIFIGGLVLLVRWVVGSGVAG